LFLESPLLLDETKWEEEKALMESYFLSILNSENPKLVGMFLFILLANSDTVAEDINLLKQMLQMNNYNLSNPTIINLQV
jgi:hypothetical protein